VDTPAALYLQEHLHRVGGPSDREAPDGPALGLPLKDGEGTSIMANKTKSHRDPRRDDLRKLGERIREQRRSRGLTQEALAETLDLSVAYVSLIERGGRNPPYTTVIAIARALNIPASRIVAED
jgi:DNA-binding XRE family transcriptional regulator